MAVKAIIFDFDGTLADTYDAFVEIINSLSGEFGYQPATPDDLKRLKNLSSLQIIQYANIAPVKIPFILRRVKAELNTKIQSLNPIFNIEDALRHLKQQGYSLGIITSNCPDNVQAFLTSNHLVSLFDFVCSGSPLFGKHKIINQLLKRHRWNPDEVIYVGDETRDIQSAKKSKIRVIAVGWGFNSPEILAKNKPDYLVYHPQELINIIESSDRQLQQVS